MRMHLKISGFTGLKFTKFIAVIFLINGVNATIRVEIRRPIVGWVMRH